MLANNEIGTIEPIKELARIAHEHGTLFHTDAVQAVGHIPINVKELDVNMLSASAHKFNGMKGSGFLYIRKGVELHPYADGGSQEHGNRSYGGSSEKELQPHGRVLAEAPKARENSSGYVDFCGH